MKKAKFILAGVGLISTIAGALAFKAQKFNGGWRCTTKATGLCTNLTYTTTTSLAAHFTSYCTLIVAPATAPCVIKYITVDE